MEVFAAIFVYRHFFLMRFYSRLFRSAIVLIDLEEVCVCSSFA